MRDLPDFILPEEGNELSSPAPNPNDSAWKGFFLVFGLHIICNIIAIMIVPKTVFLFPLFYLPFVQWLYVAPIMIVFSNQKKMVKGALLAALIIAAPLALIMLLALAGLALCAVIMAGAGSMSHH